MRFAVATLGCKVNQYDSAVIESRLAAAGMERVEFDQPAEVYIVNTCTVTNRADAESLRIARRARRLNPAARVVMTGCLAQANPQALARSEAVDRVIGLGRIDDLVRAALGMDDATGKVAVSNLRKEKLPLDSPAATLASRTRAFLKLQEGCDRFCAFCIVPFSRGRSRSLPPRQVLAALDDLDQRGVKEVVLCGVQLGGYGRDLEPPMPLIGLLEAIAQRTRIPRLRLSSIEPDELSEAILRLIASERHFCPHFHLPLQSGADEILRRMRRPYTTGYYRELVERILDLMPDAAVGSDVIAGLPGETARHFAQSLEFLSSLPLAYFHVFPYSVRSGTTAAKLAGKVESGEIRRRAELMRSLAERKRRDFVGEFQSARLDVLLEDMCDPRGGKLRGYSRNYIRVLVDGPACLKNCEVEVIATDVIGDTLVGTMVKPPATIGVCAGDRGQFAGNRAQARTSP
jgi:threonylcarbamoyladenosine tRNA methylthiotransferase MtaB